jgi:hypothetical protein
MFCFSDFCFNDFWRRRTMKKLLVLALVLAFVGAVQADYPNIFLVNPSFETGATAPWYLYDSGAWASSMNMMAGGQDGAWYEQTRSAEVLVCTLQDLGGNALPDPLKLEAYLKNPTDGVIHVEFGFDYGVNPPQAPWWFGQSISGFDIAPHSDWALYEMTEGLGTVANTGRPVSDLLLIKAKIALITTNSAIDIDNVSVTPEPATLALLGLGGLFLRRRK